MTFPYYPGTKAVVYNGESLEMLKWMPDNSIDAVVTDPPYGLAPLPADLIVKALTAWLGGDRSHVPDGRGFMGNAWDSFVPPPAAFDECMRILKPGGHLLCFAGSRTVDLMAMSIRLAGFEIRDSIAWLYGSGFPKSMDVSKAIDKAAGAERTEGAREWSGGQRRAGVMGDNLGTQTLVKYDTPATEDARQWEGWGTALKPAFEPIVVGRKPFFGTVAANVLEYGTGALNINATRIGMSAADREIVNKRSGAGFSANVYGEGIGREEGAKFTAAAAGRWPTNVVLDESQAAELDEQTGITKSGVQTKPLGTGGIWSTQQGQAPAGPQYGDAGGASRFFPTFKYQAKAPTKERPKVDGVAHPTVKPLELMRWLVRLVTPPDGVVLDFCAGSGTTLEAAILEGFHAVGVEREIKYLPLIFERIRRATPGLGQENTA